MVNVPRLAGGVIAAILIVARPALATAQGPLEAEAAPARNSSGQHLAQAPSAWKVEVAASRPAATRINLMATPERTRMIVEMTVPVMVKASTVSDPDRVIIDLPEVEFKVDPAIGQRGEGLIKAFRYGLFGPKHSRMVLDTDGPVRIDRAEVTSGRPTQLVIDLVRADPGARPQPRPAASLPAEPFRESAFDDEAGPKPVTKHRPVVVIDPGHGGIDPGTVGAGGLLEKNVVLAVAKQLRTVLTDSRSYEVVMTRASDTYVSLNQRLRISREQSADLFISIHADAVAEENLAQAVRGGTIYTLSEHASDEQARRLAERENGADVLAGLESVPAGGSGEVRNILIDLLRRETDDFSAQIRSLLAGELRKHISLAREPQRSAAFKVLKQAHSPSVLIELGYMSNAEDQKMLRSPEWQKTVARAIATAIDTYFTTRTVGSAHK